ncbi:TetR/AcrR family transcriptional regulator [Streptomyces uncialis]|uniref:TetR family transcriptional regulator n=1 Tax=Streptomyces uncialis TaxID=1048205 RepID=A0A1Q4V2Y3_9ACTN|nr:TetR/AcrR family transcriptional regulator [Streptomyces uncialis]MCX4657878.1 TetR/AcrR family transcriptional regulator [Streptomyces uncialis]OKH92193.1 TetR family transcriptional regulator [Streptomyces uncialis]WTE15152.1 TetR/AcrR family transcriptional regulator [Streptomyces uncialis]
MAATPPSPRPSDADTRRRIIRATAALLQQQGYESTSVKRIAGTAQASPSSVYHFFPGGKQELAIEAMHHGAREFGEMLAAGLASSADPAEATAACALLLADDLRRSDWSDGCPVAVTALETVGRVPGLQEAATQALTRWQDLVTTKLTGSGIPSAEARSLAGTVISMLEGAELLSRVTADDTPLRDAAVHLAQLVRAAPRV